MYVCQICGFQAPKWFGRCPGCDSWNSLVEVIEEKRKKKGKKLGGRTKGDKEQKAEQDNGPTIIHELLERKDEVRLKTQIGEFDRVLGGGIVRGSVILLGGEPGVGKSTLLTQVASRISENSSVLYVSSEESHIQIAMRFKRLVGEKKDEEKKEKLYVLFENTIEDVFEYAEKIFSTNEGMVGGLVILDAVQSFLSYKLESAPGTVSQVREVTSEAVNFARRTGIPVMIIGHVTKEGIVAGPKTLEHMVDVVLYLESEGMWRVLRSTKNRFGSTGEIGIFTMTERGLSEVQDPSIAFLYYEELLNTPGICLSAVVEGTRVYIVEVQALVSKTHFSVPRRSSQGYDIVRLNTLTAVLEKIAGLTLWDKDIFVNIAGGLRVMDVSADLAVSLAIISSYHSIPLGKVVAVGEIGLLGEIRPPQFIEQRLKEAQRVKVDKIITGKIDNSQITAQHTKILSFLSISELHQFILKSTNDFK